MAEIFDFNGMSGRLCVRIQKEPPFIDEEKDQKPLKLRTITKTVVNDMSAFRLVQISRTFKGNQTAMNRSRQTRTTIHDEHIFPVLNMTKNILQEASLSPRISSPKNWISHGFVNGCIKRTSVSAIAKAIRITLMVKDEKSRLNITVIDRTLPRIPVAGNKRVVT